MIPIRRLQPEDAPATSFLVMAAFHAAVAAHYSAHGVDAFTAYADPAHLARRGRAGHVAWLAEGASGPTGMVELRLPAHIAMLFVAPDRQGRGVGSALLEHAIRFARERDPNVAEITVNASPNAAAFYRGQGFADTGPEREKDGVRFTPMRKPL